MQLREYRGKKPKQRSVEGKNKNKKKKKSGGSGKPWSELFMPDVDGIYKRLGVMVPVNYRYMFCIEKI